MKDKKTEDLPDIFQRIVKRKKKLCKTGRTISQIIEDGSVEEKAAVFIRSQDFEKHKLKGRYIMTKKQVAALDESFTPREHKRFELYYHMYLSLSAYQREMYKLVKLYQVGVGTLAREVTRWDEYNKMAETLSFIYGGKDEAEIQEELKKLDSMINSDLVQYKYDPEKKAIVADIFQDGGLYERIKEAQGNAEEYLAMVKACIVVAEDYLGEYYFVCPIGLEIDIDRIKMETYSRLLIDKKHHISEINHKKIDKGESISPEEELFAVVPDYYEVEPDKDFLKYSKNGLEQIRKRCS